VRLRPVRLVLAGILCCGLASRALAAPQASQTAPATQAAQTGQAPPKGPSPLFGPNWGGQVTDAVPPPAPASTASLKSLGSDRLRISVDFLAGYGFDGANAPLGFEQQGRVAYATFTARGVLSPRFSYVISMNPVNEIDPLPGCGAAGFFFPNDPTFLYGPSTTIDCQPSNGDRRVDSYRSVALDMAPQQGALREAYFDVKTPVRIRFGRTRLPIGFDWQEAGSFSAKDATRIQRIDTRASFGALFSYVKTRSGHERPLFTGTVGAYAPGGNRYLDYNYYYFNDSSLNANSSPSYLGAASVVPIDAVEVRVAYQHGTTGSKVERLPSYWASKRNDNALVLSVAVRPTKFLRIFAEKANYTWGPTTTSAEMLGVDPTPIHKNGYYVTGEGWWPVRPTLTVGGSVSVERVDRADSLVRYAIEQGLFGVEPGRRDGMTVVRGYVDFSQFVRFGVYKVWDDNPYPWLSGIWPVTGPQAFTGKVTNTWGMMVRLLVK
jgi:hypothetical protein